MNKLLDLLGEELTQGKHILENEKLYRMGQNRIGKTYISCALGVNACHSGYKSKYIRLPNLFREIEVARTQGKYEQLMKHYENCQLLILDEFLLVSTTETEQRDLLELIEMRCGISATIICSQFVTEGWHEKLGGRAMADSIWLLFGSDDPLSVYHDNQR